MYVAFKDHRHGKCHLDNIHEGTTIEFTIPPSWKWLSGDRVNPATGLVVERAVARHKAIVGIVDFLNRTRCGFTNKGVPLYYFHPLDTAYPTMIVSSKLQPQQNQFAVVSLEHWDDIWPRAGIQTLLGAVGDKCVEEKALYTRSMIPKYRSSAPADTATTLSIAPVADYDAVINIDPTGCEDVDDVFCWKRIEGGYEFAIAIADVAAWVAEDTDTDRIAQQKGETIYVDGAVVDPMLPVELSTSAASLRCDGQPRPVVARVYTIRNGEVIDQCWKCMNVRVSAAYTYETIYEDITAVATLRECLTAIHGDNSNDSHRWVEIAMIAYNAAAATTLREAKVGVLRSHKGTVNTEWQALAAKTGCAELAHMGTAKGTYVYATSPDDVSHSGLGLSLYCHASSPIRRYADLINQRYLKHILAGTTKPGQPSLPSHLNTRSRLAKALERDLWFLKNLNTDRITEQTGFLLSFKPERNTWTVYVPAWRRTVKAKANDNKTETLMSGMSVSIEIFTNLTSVSWSDRIVCSINKIKGDSSPFCALALPLPRNFRK